MKYEKIRCERDPYKLWIGGMAPFCEHRHGDYEIAYCLKGNLDIILDKQTVRVEEGELLVIPPMTAHYVAECGNRRFLCAILGVSFFHGHYSAISDFTFPSYVLRFNREDPCHRRIVELLEHTAELCQDRRSTAGLMRAGNLYNVMAMLIDSFAIRRGESAVGRRDMIKVGNVERALELIYSSYTEPITVEQAAQAAGYSKSNFCKIFKQVTGSSFHKMLNSYRISNACNLLSDTEMQISEIAREVGLAEAKTLCRLFRDEMACSPLEYRSSCVKRSDNK